MSITITRNPAIGGAAGGGASPADVAAAVIAAMPAPATGAVSGEVKLFALAANQALPDGWQLDAAREINAADLPATAIMPVYSAVSAGTATSGFAVQLSDGLVTWGYNGLLTKSNQSTGATLFTVATPFSLGQAGLPMTCSLQGKLFMAGGADPGGFRKANVYETSGAGVHLELNSLPAARSYGSAIELPGGRVLVVGGYTGAGTSNELLLFTRGVGWVTLTTEALDEDVLWPHLATLPSGKVGIFSGAVKGTTTKSSKYYIFDPVTLKRSVARTIPAQHVPYSYSDAVTLRTESGCAYMTANPAADGNLFSEYNEALDNFSKYQVKLPASYINPQSSNTTQFVAQDHVAGPFGHVLFPAAANVRPFNVLNSGLIPSYRYARKT